MREGVRWGGRPGGCKPLQFEPALHRPAVQVHDLKLQHLAVGAGLGRHVQGVRAALPGMESRWGPWYELGRRRYQYGIYLTDAQQVTAPRGAVVARVRFRLGTTDYGVAASVSPDRRQMVLAR